MPYNVQIDHIMNTTNKQTAFSMAIMLTMTVPAFTTANTHATTTEHARLKAEYETMNKTLNTKTGDTITHTGKYILQLAPTASYYYDPQTHLIDSLENDPEGRRMLDEADKAAFEKAKATGGSWIKIRNEMGISRNKRYKCRKDFTTGKITAWDTNMGDRYRYEVDMDDLKWELGDSTKNVLGYECQMATADYHGRKWIAWFTTDVGVSDGPWQLCGLPGLIMEAITADKEYGFTIKGLQQCDEPLKDPYEDKEKTFYVKRISALRQKDYVQRNRAAHISAMTGGAVKLKHTEYKENIDFIETDYHEKK